MPIATKTRTSLLTDDFKNQIANNVSLNSTVVPPAVQEEKSVEEVPAPVSEPKGKYNDVANLHFSRGKKAEFKAFFSANEVTLVQGVENAVNYIMKEVKAGRLKISRNGIEKVGE